jgi:hypothetical protein
MGQAANLHAGIAVGVDQEHNQDRGRFGASEIEAGGGTIDRLRCAVVIISAKCPCTPGGNRLWRKLQLALALSAALVTLVVCRRRHEAADLSRE